MNAFTHVCRVLNSTRLRRVAGMGDAAVWRGILVPSSSLRLSFSFPSQRQFHFITALAATLVILAAAPARSDALTAYPLEICIVSGDKLDKDAVVFSYQGREIRTCCTNCVDEFYKDPAGFVAKIDEAASRVAR
jgi:hypothetical protein